MSTPTITRPPVAPNRTQVALRVPEDLCEQLTVLAISERLPRNAYIVRLLDAAVRADPEALADAYALVARQSA